MPSVYILYSKSLGKYYTGLTTLDVSDRINRLLQHFYENKFTPQAKDWEVFMVIECVSSKQATSIEKHIIPIGLCS